jgi:hypothetical protein
LQGKGVGAFHAAEVALAAGAGRVGDVAADIKIEFAVAIMVEKSSAGVKPGAELHPAHASFIGDIAEGAVAIVVIEHTFLPYLVVNRSGKPWLS